MFQYFMRRKSVVVAMCSLQDGGYVNSVVSSILFLIGLLDVIRQAGPFYAFRITYPCYM